MVIVAIDSEDEVDDNERLDGRRMNPARGGTKSFVIPFEDDPFKLEVEDTLDIDEVELLGDKLGVEGDRRGEGI